MKLFLDILCPFLITGGFIYMLVCCFIDNDEHPVAIAAALYIYCVGLIVASVNTLTLSPA